MELAEPPSTQVADARREAKVKVRIQASLDGAGGELEGSSAGLSSRRT